MSLKACYDLTIGPPQYDVLGFLLYIEAVRVMSRAKHADIELTIAPTSFVKQKDWLKNISIPMCGMLPSISKITVCEDTPEEELWGKNHPVNGRNSRYYGLDRLTEGMRIAGRCMRPKMTLPANGKLVTITLREATHWPTRNSNVEEWFEAAGELTAKGYEVVFVRDTEKAEQPLDPFPICPAASVDIHHRAALYRSAYCNLFVSNGPAVLAVALDAPVIMLRPTNESLGSCYDRKYFDENGMEKGQFPDSPKHQRLVYENDTALNIVRAFEQWRASQV